MKKYTDLIKKVFSEWSEDKAAKHAAALSYYTVFSLAPLLVILISLAGLFGGADAAEGLVMTQVENLLGEEGGQFVSDMIVTASNRPASGIIATVIGVVTLIFGALGAFGELQNALNTIWEVKPKPVSGIWGTLRNLVVDRLLSFAMILVIGFLMLVSLIVSAALAGVTEYIGGLLPFPAFLITILNFIVSIGVITLLFAAMFKFLPDAKIAWRDVWLGALVTALLFTLGKFAIGFYLGRSNVSTTFGAAGSLAIMLIWIYYSAQILFLGAEFTQVYANAYGSGIEPNENAVKITDEERAQQGLARPETVEQKALEKEGGRPAGRPAARNGQTVTAPISTGLDYRQMARSSHLLPPPERRRTRRTGQIVSVALLGGVLALVTSFAQIVKDVRRPGNY